MWIGPALQWKKATGISLFDKGIPIDTEIRTLYGIARAYDADHFILAYCSDPREFHLHRMIERAFNPFGMSFAGLETRSVHHMNFGNRSPSLAEFMMERATKVSRMVDEELLPKWLHQRGIDPDEIQ